MNVLEKMSYAIVDYKIKRAMKKQIALDQKEYPILNHATISVKAMCQHLEESGKPNYFLPIRNRIIREIEKDDLCAEHVYISPNDLEDISLGTDGVFLFSDILMGYFGEKEMLNLYRYMSSTDKINRNEWQMQKILCSLNNAQLLDMAYDTEIKNNETVMDYIKQEMKRRKLKAAV